MPPKITLLTNLFLLLLAASSFAWPMEGGSAEDSESDRQFIRPTAIDRSMANKSLSLPSSSMSPSLTDRGNGDVSFSEHPTGNQDVNPIDGETGTMGPYPVTIVDSANSSLASLPHNGLNAPAATTGAPFENENVAAVVPRSAASVQADPLAGIPQERINAWMDAMSEAGRENAFDVITGKSGASAAMPMTEDRQASVRNALFQRLEQRNAEQYEQDDEDAVTVPATSTSSSRKPARRERSWAQFLSNPVAAALGYFDASTSRSSAYDIIRERRELETVIKQLETAIKPIEGVPQTLVGSYVKAALENNEQLMTAHAQEILGIINEAGLRHNMSKEALQATLESRVAAVPVDLTNKILASSEAALLASVWKMSRSSYDFENNQLCINIKRAQDTDNPESAILWRRAASQIADLWSRPVSNSDDSRSYHNDNEAYFCDDYASHIYMLKYFRAMSLQSAADSLERAKKYFSSNPEIESLWKDLAQQYITDASILLEHVHMAIYSGKRPKDDYLMMCWSDRNSWPPSKSFFARVHHWTLLLEDELLAAEPNQQNINRYRKALSTMKQALECYQANMNLKKHFIAEDTPALGLLAASRNVDNHAAEGPTKYHEAQYLFLQAADKYALGDVEQGDILSAQAQAAKEEAESLDPSSSDSLLK